MKLWKGRFQKEADPKTNDFNSSISIDSRMYKEDIEGSIAHATMLGAAGIIDKGESEKICAELEKIEKDIETGALHIDPDAEDIHTFIEGELTVRIGDAGKRLHTARSRNDQVALDVRLTLRKECAEWIEQEEDVLSYAQFPKVALDFFKKRRDAKYGIDGKHADAEKEIHPV